MENILFSSCWQSPPAQADRNVLSSTLSKHAMDCRPVDHAEPWYHGSGYCTIIVSISSTLSLIPFFISYLPLSSPSLALSCLSPRLHRLTTMEQLLPSVSLVLLLCLLSLTFSSFTPVHCVVFLVHRLSGDVQAIGREGSGVGRVSARIAPPPLSCCTCHWVSLRSLPCCCPRSFAEEALRRQRQRSPT